MLNFKLPFWLAVSLDGIWREQISLSWKALTALSVPRLWTTWCQCNFVHESSKSWAGLHMWSERSELVFGAGWKVARTSQAVLSYLNLFKHSMNSSPLWQQVQCQTEGITTAVQSIRILWNLPAFRWCTSDSKILFATRSFLHAKLVAWRFQHWPKSCVNKQGLIRSVHAVPDTRCLPKPDD